MKNWVSKHRFWIIIAIFSLLIFCVLIANITIEIKKNNNSELNTAATVFSIISTWIGGIGATIIGAVAIWQSHFYRRENDKQNKISSLRQSLQAIELLYVEFVNSVYINDSIYTALKEMQIFKKDAINSTEMALLSELKKLERKIFSIANGVSIDIFFLDGRKELLNSMLNLQLKVREMQIDIENSVVNNLPKKEFNEKTYLIQNLEIQCIDYFAKFNNNAAKFISNISKKTDSEIKEILNKNNPEILKISEDINQKICEINIKNKEFPTN